MVCMYGMVWYGMVWSVSVCLCLSLSVWLAGWLAGRVAGRLAGWLAGCLAVRQAGWQAGWLAGWLTHFGQFFCDPASKNKNPVPTRGHVLGPKYGPHFGPAIRKLTIRGGSKKRPPFFG